MSGAGAIRARAPGKVVLWGEYAVLAGAPALVMAVNRYACCTLAPGGSGWRFAAPGFAAGTVTVSPERLADPEPPPAGAAWGLVWYLMQSRSGDRSHSEISASHSEIGASHSESEATAPHRGPAGAEVCLDTRSFQEHGRKLGLGSSAALCVAAHGAVARLLGEPASFAAALDAHRRFQGGAGSGIDVAAAWHGGTLRFERSGAGEPAARPCPLPGGLETRFVFAGESASTPRHLDRFRRWLDGGDGEALGALCAASAALFEADDPLPALGRYVEALHALDDAADLGIYSAAHRRLERLAFDAGVVYKPCGAGGGDIGAAFTADPAAAERFTSLAAGDTFLTLALETASHGIEVAG